MLTRLSVKGFKTLVDFDVPLSKVTVLVGPNNCGKSNVLKALAFLGAAARGSLHQEVLILGGAKDVHTRGDAVPLALTVEGVFSGSKITYSFTPQSRDELGAETFQVGDWRGASLEGGYLVAPGGEKIMVGGGPGNVLRMAAGHPGCPAPLREFHSFLAGCFVADFSTASIREPSLVATNAELASTGRGLAAALDRLDSERPDLRTSIDSEVSRAIPRVTKVVTIPVLQQGYKVVGVAEGREVFRGEAVSDGVLLFVALTTVTQMSGGKTIVCLEEPDRGIHPRRIREVLDQVYGLANAGSQFILTTHSPVLLNEFRDYPESVLILDRDDSGTHAKQLSELPDVEAQMKDVQLGDLWYSGVLGGVPKR